MYVHPLTLTFRFEQDCLEQPFQAEYFVRSLPIIRFVCVFGLLVYAVFGILDAYLVPEQKNVFWVFRYAVFTPFCLALFFISFLAIFKKIVVPVLILWEVLAGAGIIMMIMLAPPPASFSYYAGLILVLMIGYTLVRQRFVWATVAGWLLFIMYEIVAVFFCDTPDLILLNNNFFFIGANLIGMVACYSVEYYARRDFSLKKLLESEREKVRHARDVLEDTVTMRTAQLVERNALLTQEIAERKQIQAQLLRHQKMESIGLVAGGVAHDLNNILSGIITYPELLLLDLPEDSKLRKPIEEIMRSGQRAAAIVADLLTVARGVAQQPEVVCINDLVESYLSSPEYEKVVLLYPEIDVRVELNADLPDCRCSSVHIQKVLMNLVNNAFEAIDGSGCITISTKVRHLSGHGKGEELLGGGDYIALAVVDSGPGITEDVLQHIFEPFYTKKVMGRSGTGLGLAVVWNTMQEHDGTVVVESSEKGTLFTAYLPVTTEDRKVAGGDDEVANLQGAGTVLVVDDEEIQRDIGEQILTTLGYEVVAVESGEKAILYLQDNRVDLLLLDMLMDPGLNGLQTYRGIIKIHPGQKAIIVSGFSESADVKAVLELGTAKFIKKPYSMKDLGLAARELLFASS